MYNRLALACALIALLTFVSCSETSNPNVPDNSNNNNNNNKAKRIVYHSVNGEKDTNVVLWVSDIDGGNKRELVRGNIMSNSPIYNEKVIIVERKYNSEKQMHFSTLYIYDLKTNSKEALFEMPISIGETTVLVRGETALSPDGKKLCFIVDSNHVSGSKVLFKRHKLYVMDLSTKAIKLLADDVAKEQNLSISPDGQYIAYYGSWYDNETPTDKLYIVSLDGTVKKMITGDISYAYDNYSSREWSSDNQYLITNHRDRDKFQLINRNTWQIERTIEFQGLKRVGNVVFSRDNNLLYFTALTNDKGPNGFVLDVFSYVLSTGKLSQLIGNKISGGKMEPKVSGDGTTLLFSSLPNSATETDYYFYRTLHTINLKDSTITTLPNRYSSLYQFVE